VVDAGVLNLLSRLNLKMFCMLHFHNRHRSLDGSDLSWKEGGEEL
jgi:hypothetical protein